jgi:hypothetical protein
MLEASNTALNENDAVLGYAERERERERVLVCVRVRREVGSYRLWSLYCYHRTSES